MFTNTSNDHQLNEFGIFCSSHPKQEAICVTTQPVVGTNFDFLNFIMMLRAASDCDAFDCDAIDCVAFERVAFERAAF